MKSEAIAREKTHKVEVENLCNQVTSFQGAMLEAVVTSSFDLRLLIDT